jgi:hypothetical protein
MMVVGEREWLVDWTRLSSIIPRLFGPVDAPCLAVGKRTCGIHWTELFYIHLSNLAY